MTDARHFKRLSLIWIVLWEDECLRLLVAHSGDAAHLPGERNDTTQLWMLNSS